MDQQALTAAERRKAEEMCASRARLTWWANGLAALLLALGFARFVLGDLQRGRGLSLTVGLFVAATLVIAAVLWFIVWDLVRAMRADLAAGRKELRTGTLGVCHPEGKYGDAPFLLDGERDIDRSRALTGLREGDRVTIAYLPVSRVVLSARKAD